MNPLYNISNRSNGQSNLITVIVSCNVTLKRFHLFKFISMSGVVDLPTGKSLFLIFKKTWQMFFQFLEGTMK